MQTTSTLLRLKQVYDNNMKRNHKMKPPSLSPFQLATLCLWRQVNASLSAYYKLIQNFDSVDAAIKATSSQWKALGIHDKHIDRHKDKNATDIFIEQVKHDINTGRYQILFLEDTTYPTQLKQLFDPPPLLFVKGNSAQLHNAQIAMVGSRKPSPHAQKITFDMAQYLAQSGYVVTSGLAQGVDGYAHQGALSQTDETAKGRTIGVLGTGIDVVYPRHHAQLFQQIIADGGCLVSELLPGTPASKHTFPRRNRLVAGLSLGTIVTEASLNSGSLITARLTSEQGKQVFAVPSHIDNANAEGCHHLIREGATLIYHPMQVLDDLQYQRQSPQIVVEDKPKSLNNAPSLTTKKTESNATNKPTTSPTIQVDKMANLPAHLLPVYELLDWSGVDLDTLVAKRQLDTQTLLGQLMELELMGLIMQQGGRYFKT